MILIWSRVCYLALSSWSEGILFVFPRIQPCTSYIPGTQYIICWINECVVAGTLFDSVTTHVGCADVSWHRIFLDLAQQGHLKAWRYSMKKKKKLEKGHIWMLRDEREGSGSGWRRHFTPMEETAYERALKTGGISRAHGRPHVREGVRWVPANSDFSCCTASPPFPAPNLEIPET